ncbi:GNAT family N-acetyltransferase [Clostridium tunisiense]|uniref:GNAT family N-acetyltransferase n=1 Tax=Clostridium tunisiense TaxID=219748 RepID=UPI0002F5E6CF|nr:GNAT family protein [Clostridium tunisiense]
MSSNENMIPDVFPQIETERLMLKEVSLANSMDMFEIFSDEETLKYYDVEPVHKVAEVNKLIEVLQNRFKNKRGIRWGLYLKDSGKLIGTCGYHDVNREALRAEIGYELSRDFWRKGYMKEALEVILDYGFNNMGLNRIQALVEPENEKSIGILKRVGFTKEGVLRDYEYFRRCFKHCTMLSILKREYKKDN